MAKIRARNIAGWSELSEEPSTTTESLTIQSAPLSAPSNLRTLSLSKNSIQLAWNEVLDTGYSPITNYKVYRNDGGSSTTFNLVGEPTTTTLIVTGLTPLTNYTFYVTARNIHGTGPNSTFFV